MRKTEEVLLGAYAAHRGQVYAFLQKLCADGDAAEKMTTETFLRVRGKLRPGGSREVLIKLLRAAAETFLRELRHMRKAEFALAFYVADPEAPLGREAGGWLVRTVRREALYRAFSALRKRDVTMLLLRLYGEAEYGEIAALFGISEISVRTVVLRTKDRIREELFNE